MFSFQASGKNITCAASVLGLRGVQRRRSLAAHPCQRARPSPVHRREIETTWRMMPSKYQKSAVHVKTRGGVTSIRAGQRGAMQPQISSTIRPATELFREAVPRGILRSASTVGFKGSATHRHDELVERLP